MSAFMVSTRHVDVILASVLRGKSGQRPSWCLDDPDTTDWQDRRYENLDFTTADRAGLVLLAENARSVRYRYDDADEVGMIDDTDVIGYTYRDPGFTPTAVEGLKAIACLEYQSCEHPEWRTSEARRILDAVHSHLVHALPGMESAPWDWDDADIRAAVAR